MMEIIKASLLSALQQSGGSSGQTLFQKVLTLPTIGAVYIYDDYYLVAKSDVTGSVLPNVPSVSPSGTTYQGQEIAYIYKEWLIKPTIWYCLAKDGYADSNIKLASYGGYFTYDGYGKQNEYRFDSSEGYGVFLYEDYTMQGTQTINFSFPSGQTSIGWLNVNATIGWTYAFNQYNPDGSRHARGTRSDSMTMSIGMPGNFSNPVSDMSASDILALWQDFEQVCEAKRKTL